VTKKQRAQEEGEFKTREESRVGREKNRGGGLKRGAGEKNEFQDVAFQDSQNEIRAGKSLQLLGKNGRRGIGVSGKPGRPGKSRKRGGPERA